MISVLTEYCSNFRLLNFTRVDYHVIHKTALLILVILAVASVGIQYMDVSAHRWGGSLYEAPRGLFLLLLSTVLVGLTGLLVLARVFSPNEISSKPSR
ncbi:MAG: hypothetical protein HMLIMOIP_001858 [Candidatus Nitrosomirales archaeon]|jgi:hypothetical protein